MNAGLTSGAGSRAIMLVVFLMTMASGAVLAMEPALQDIQTKIEQDFRTVHHIDTKAFSMLKRDQVVIFDVRGRAEYDVSHIEGAIHVDPGTSPDDFIHAYSDRLNGKTVVFYCSVGRRSSTFASRVNALVEKSGATGSYNLAGGLFQWRNEERPLTHDGEATAAIHPYNWYWGRLISDKSAIHYVPERPPPPTHKDLRD